MTKTFEHGSSWLYSSVNSDQNSEIHNSSLSSVRHRLLVQISNSLTGNCESHLLEAWHSLTADRRHPVLPSDCITFASLLKFFGTVSDHVQLNQCSSLPCHHFSETILVVKLVDFVYILNEQIHEIPRTPLSLYAKLPVLPELTN